jgi:hypothetical protein
MLCSAGDGKLLVMDQDNIRRYRHEAKRLHAEAEMMQNQVMRRQYHSWLSSTNGSPTA